jgi:hypothetical protein
MGDQITISGGADGVTARYDDMLSTAGLLDRVAGSLGDVALALGKMNLSADLVEAGLLCPVEVARAEEALVAANVGYGGAARVLVDAEASAAFLRFSVTAYRDVDKAMSVLGNDLAFVGGFVAGVVAVPVLAYLALTNPGLDLYVWEHRGELPGDAQTILYDNPWLEELLTRTTPGFVQGLTFDVTGGSLPLLSLLSGGHWPTADFSTAVQGLVSFGALFGVLQDTGNFTVKPIDEKPAMTTFSQESFVGELMQQEITVDNLSGEVQIITVDGPNGKAYIVEIPGTQVWDPKRGDNPVDASTNVNLEAGYRTKMEEATAQAMQEAGIKPGDPVMLMGHSQGGITAADMAADPAYRSRFNITSVVTAGSPIGHVQIPGNVSVLSLEENQDIVPKLDGADNPDTPNWITVHRQLTPGSGPNEGTDMVSAHAIQNYADTGSMVDQSSDPAISRWRQQNSAFYGSATIQRYQISASP